MPNPALLKPQTAADGEDTTARRAEAANGSEASTAAIGASPRPSWPRRRPRLLARLGRARRPAAGVELQRLDMTARSKREDVHPC
jgi:hypothetical protein